MPYSVRARNDKHRQDLADELVLLGVDPFTARQVAMRLPGGWAKKLGEELAALGASGTDRDRCARVAQGSSAMPMIHEGPTGRHGGRREDCGFCVDQAPPRSEEK